VLLADLDVTSACTSFLMKVDFPYTLSDAASNLHRLDTDLWSGMVCHVRDGLDVLQAPGAVGISDATSSERVRHVLRFAQSQYRWVVVDLGRLTASSFPILDESPDLFVVTTTDLTALHETSRLLRRVLAVNFPRERLKLVLNRNAKGKSVPAEDIEKALGYPVYTAIGDFAQELDEAYAEGHFLDDKLKLRREVSRIVGRWRGLEEKQEATSGFGFLRRRWA